MSSILNDLYSKCLSQENDISKEISKIVNNYYPINTIDRVKTKVQDLLENFNNTINLLSLSLNNSNNNSKSLITEDKEIWKSKIEIFQQSHRNFKKRLEESVSSLKKKKKFGGGWDLLGGGEEASGEVGRNLSNLEREKQSWNTVLKMSTEIQSSAANVNEELERQNINLGNIGGKINTIFDKISGSFKDTTWIKQRGKNDKYICLFLGIVTILIIGFTYFYLKPKIRGK